MGAVSEENRAGIELADLNRRPRRTLTNGWGYRRWSARIRGTHSTISARRRPRWRATIVPARSEKKKEGQANDEYEGAMGHEIFVTPSKHGGSLCARTELRSTNLTQKARQMGEDRQPPLDATASRGKQPRGQGIIAEAVMGFSSNRAKRACSRSAKMQEASQKLHASRWSVFLDSSLRLKPETRFRSQPSCCTLPGL